MVWILRGTRRGQYTCDSLETTADEPCVDPES